jgi:hypothetical protein
MHTTGAGKQLRISKQFSKEHASLGCGQVCHVCMHGSMLSYRAFVRHLKVR